MKSSTKSKAVMQVTKSLNKKGKLKGKNKKETKMLKGMCPHHKLNKHGKVKPTIFSNDGESLICELCGARFPGHFFSNSEIKEIVEDMEVLNNQNKFMAVAIGAGEGTVDFFAQMGVALKSYKKNSKKLRNVAEKQNKVKKKSKSASGSANYGSWGRR